MANIKAAEEHKVREIGLQMSDYTRELLGEVYKGLSRNKAVAQATTRAARMQWLEQMRGAIWFSPQGWCVQYTDANGQPARCILNQYATLDQTLCHAMQQAGAAVPAQPWERLLG
jgi:hypothetical protein